MDKNNIYIPEVLFGSLEGMGRKDWGKRNIWENWEIFYIIWKSIFL